MKKLIAIFALTFSLNSFAAQKIIDYEILDNHGSLVSFQTVIEAEIANGWQPFGPPCTLYSNNEKNGGSMLCQALVKYADNN